jgi:4,5-dihydroxyphthalate decarboxylase
MAKLQLNLGCGVYDRTSALADGTIQPEGIELNFISLGPYEVIRRMLHHEEFDVSEFSLSNYLILLARGDKRFIGIPVFPYRAFRHSMIWINSLSGIHQPRDLVGKRIGIPEYSVTALLFLRGMLIHDFGVKPEDIQWFRSNVERIGLDLPENIRLANIGSDQTLDNMLATGDLDAATLWKHPRVSRNSSPFARRLFNDTKQVEIDYYCRTGIFPIMHLIVVRREVYERNRWVAQSLMKAFQEAKEKCYERTRKLSPLYSLTPWLRLEIEASEVLFGEDMYPYGVRQNLATLSAATLYSYEQGLSVRHVSVKEMFAPETLDSNE